MFKYSTLTQKAKETNTPSGAGGFPGVRSPSAGASGGLPADAECVGLSHAHNGSRGTGKITLWEDGSLLKVEKSEKKPPAGGGKRGKISGFSVASRRRMLYMMAKTRVEKKPYMLTLTYPSEFVSPRESKRHLKNFILRLKRKFPDCGGVWKLEPQKRGAPHYHLLVWTNAGYLALLAFTARAWYYVVGSHDEKHLRAGTKVEKIRSPRGVMAYAGKYVAKTSQKLDLEPEIIAMWDTAGRWWGTWGQENIPWAQEIYRRLDYAQVVGLFRLLRRYARIRARQYSSLTVFCAANWWRDRFPDILKCVT